MDSALKFSIERFLINICIKLAAYKVVLISDEDKFIYSYTLYPSLRFRIFVQVQKHA